MEALWITGQLAAAAGAGVEVDDFASPLVFDVEEVSLAEPDDSAAFFSFFSPSDEPLDAALLSVR